MNSDRYEQVPNPSTSPRSRLEMKDQEIGHGHVDGGWWPRSYDAAEEFPPLIDALSARLGRIERIGYDMDAWHSVTRKWIHRGDLVRSEGFHTVFAHTVSIISIAGQRLSLLVVPPETSKDIAETALHAASELVSTATVQDILARAGLLVATPGGARPDNNARRHRTIGHGGRRRVA
jgi:hypothetical protein